LHSLDRHPSTSWRLACLTAALVVWGGLQARAATVSTHTFGRYEIILQEGLPIAEGEMLGTVRRQTGLPEYPLLLGMQKRLLELSILGPGNRPIRLASTPFSGQRAAAAATMRLLVERSVRQDETLTLWVRRGNAPRQVSLTVDLRTLERMLEGPR
jgi:hypothetical protein